MSLDKVNKRRQLPKSFNILFRLDKHSVKKLDETISTFLSQKNGSGLILDIDKNAFVFEKLFFLKPIILHFYRLKVPLGIWGLPYCVMQQILGGYLYAKLQEYLIQEPKIFAFKLHNIQDSALLLECKRCIKAKVCSGLGHLACNRSQFAWRMANHYRFEQVKNLPLQGHAKKAHGLFVKHICHYPQEETDRAMAYAKVFSKSGSFTYTDRFIYYCNYLLASQIRDEKELILAHTKNRRFIENLFRFYLSYFERYAYSLAYGEKIRETIYGFFIDGDRSKDLLGKLTFDLHQHPFEDTYYFFGVDLIDGMPDAYKLYSKISNDTSFFNYLAQHFSFVFPPEILKISYDFLLVRRLAANKKLSSIKVEMYCNDFAKLTTLVYKYYDIRLKSNEHFEIDRIAFDIDLQGILNKITVYYSIG